MRKQGRRIGEQRRGSEPDTAAAAAVGECHPGTTCPTFRLAQPLFLNVLYFSISVFWYFCIALFFLFLQKFCILQNVIWTNKKLWQNPLNVCTLCLADFFISLLLCTMCRAASQHVITYDVWFAAGIPWQGRVGVRSSIWIQLKFYSPPSHFWGWL